MKAKVIHIVTRLDLGGAQQNTLHTVEHLDPARFEPVLICGEGGYLDREAARLARRDPPVRSIFLPDLVREINPLRDLIALFQLRQILADERPDVVHTHSSKAGILGRLAAWLAGVPVILHTFHGFGFHDGMNPPVRWSFVLLESLAAAVSDRLIFVSKANMDYARGYGLGDPGRYVLIRSGVRLSRFPAPIGEPGDKKRDLGLPPDAPLVVGVGNLKPQKNAGDFLLVAERVLRGRPEARFAFIGDGPLRPALEAAVKRKGLFGKLRFMGWREDVAEVLAAADVFLLTSLWEGLPRALVEAMKTGLPCASYAVDGVRDVVVDGETGLLARARDWEALAGCLERLLADPGLRERLGAAAAGSIGKDFDIDEMVRRQERLLDRLLSGVRG